MKIKTAVIALALLIILLLAWAPWLTEEYVKAKLQTNPTFVGWHGGVENIDSVLKYNTGITRVPFGAVATTYEGMYCVAFWGEVISCPFWAILPIDLLQISYLAYHELIAASLHIFEDSRIKPCSELPTIIEVEKILQEHGAAYTKIEQILERKGWIGIDYYTQQRCPGKADIEIAYPTLKEREKIKSLIGDSFFGVPYRLNNI